MRVWRGAVVTAGARALGCPGLFFYELGLARSTFRCVSGCVGSVKWRVFLVQRWVGGQACMTARQNEAFWRFLARLSPSLSLSVCLVSVLQTCPCGWCASALSSRASRLVVAFRMIMGGGDQSRSLLVRLMVWRVLTRLVT